MLPVLAIVGCPNVGKSTLFNRLTKTRDAIVADYPGVTRDRRYGEIKFADKEFIVIDTGGLAGEKAGIEAHMEQQARLAIQESDAVLFMVDAHAGLTATDEAIANELRQLSKPIYLVVNKIDGVDVNVALAEFYKLGLGELFSIAALHGRGVTSLLTTICAAFPELVSDAQAAATQAITFAITGRPNVGKSTLVNRILGEERVLVFDEPGTTRDSLLIPFERRGKAYQIIDTAGVRRRTKVKQEVEKFSVVRALQAIASSAVVVFMFDARQEVAEQDLRLLRFVLDAGKGLVLVINKWDGMSEHDKQMFRKELDRRLEFVTFARMFFISALHGTGVGEIFSAIEEAYRSTMKKLSTPQLTKALQKIVTQHPPPLIRTRRIKLRYAHAGGHNPPLIVIHGNQTESLPESYRRYLINAFRKAFNLIGTPIRLQLKSGENPYADKKNPLSDRQQKKRKRLLRFVKKK